MARLTTTDGVLQTSDGVIQTTTPNFEIDYFDDGDLSEYSGDTSLYATVTSPVEDGAGALEGQSNSDGSESAILSLEGDGLPNYVDQGQTWTYHFQLGDGSDIALFWIAAQSRTPLPDGYRIQAGTDALAISLSQSGSQTLLANEDAPTSNHLNEWLRADCEWTTGGDFEVCLYNEAGYEIARASANDTTFADGGVGWGAYSDDGATGTMHYDSARILNAIAPATIVDGYQDGDISEYSGDTLDFSTVTSPVAHSGHSLECTTGVSGGTTGISSTSGLNAYPSAGDTFWLAMYHPADDHHLQAAFAVQSEDATADCYAVQGSPRDDTFKLVKWSGGSFGIEATTPHDYTGDMDTWLHAKVEWGTDGATTATLYDETKTAIAGPISATLTDWSSGGFGWRVLTGLASQVAAYGDFCRITS